MLSYPILITLERPVRITPEQAARDHYGALSHHLPHHRRMWLLLERRGRVSPHFASYEGFRNYWNSRIAQLRKGHAGPFSPLVFVVEDFRVREERREDGDRRDFRGEGVRPRPAERGPDLELPRRADVRPRAGWDVVPRRRDPRRADGRWGGGAEVVA